VGVFQPAVHRAIVIVDVENFGDPARTNAHQLAVRDAMYKALRQSFGRARISWAGCAVEDRGDGILVLVSPEVPKSWLVTRLPARLAEMLGRHNAGCPAAERIRLRMALHAGEVHQDTHGFAGTAVNRAFRLIEAPPSRAALRDSAGVVALIVSDWFYDEVVRHHPAAGPSCFRQVRAVMKETEMTAWVRVLGGPEPEIPVSGDTGQPVPAEPPQPGQPPSSLPVVRHSLPPDMLAFTGREEELDRITTAVTQADGAGGAGRAGGVVAIHAIGGMPGVGKTALAVRAAHLLQDRFPDRQLFIDLHAHTPGQDPLLPQAALAGLLSAVGVDTRYLPEDLDSRAGLWRDRMAGQRALLVLDNAASTAQVAPLLPGGDGCLVLVTSRRHLADLPAAAVPLLLETLPQGKAQEMFTRLAPRAADDPAAAVAELAGHLPLAISLLARVYARHPAWTLADLAAETRASMLTLAAEASSVAAAFKVSYRYLDPRQQEFFRCLGLHPGAAIDAYAAAALAGTGLPDAATQLDVLHGEGLLTEIGYRRYGMHDLIRRYARDLAAASPAADREQALGRLLDYYQHTAAITGVRLARQTRTSPVPASAAAPAAVPDLPDHARALAWARAERASLLACLDHVTGTGQHTRVVALTAAIADFLRIDGPWADAAARHATAVQAARHLGDRPGQANALNNLGIARRLTGDCAGAACFHGEALSLSRDADDRLGQANALNNLGIARQLTGDYADAARALEEALGLSRGVGDRLGQANALNNLGIARKLTGDFPDAARAMEEALSLHRDLGDRRGQANALNNLGTVRQLTGDYVGAARALEEALSLHRDLGDRRGQANALNNLGIVRQLTEDFPDAARALEEALGLYGDLGDRRGQANALNNLGTVRRLTGDYVGAARALEEALGLYRDLSDRGGEAEALNEAGSLNRVRGDLSLAGNCHRQALDLAREIGSSWDEAHALAGLGRCALVAGRDADAEAGLRQAREIFQRISAAETSGVSAELDALTKTRPTA
jgi:tetratricopeptide (TPR) repeat protein